MVESDSVENVAAEHFTAVGGPGAAFCERVSEAPSHLEESKQGSIKTVHQIATEMSFSDSMVGGAGGGRP